MTAYEDVFYYLWKERVCRSTSIRSIPSSKIPSSARAWPRFRRGPGQDVGYVLPLRRIPDPLGARRAGPASPGFSRLEANVSGPGRFADGLSLAARISSLDQTGRRSVFLRSRSLCEARRACPKGPRASARTFRRSAVQAPTLPRRPRQTAKPPGERRIGALDSRPALCVQPREGKLFIFMPPVEYLATISIWSPPSKTPPLTSKCR
jgi:hypothetical protein